MQEQQYRYDTAITTSQGNLQGIQDHLPPGALISSSLFEQGMPAETAIVERGWETT